MRVTEGVIAKLLRISIYVWFQNLNPINPIVLSSTYLHTMYLLSSYVMISNCSQNQVSATEGRFSTSATQKKSMMHLTTTYSVKYIMTRSPNPLLLPPSLNPPHLHLLWLKRCEKNATRIIYFGAHTQTPPKRLSKHCASIDNCKSNALAALADVSLDEGDCAFSNRVSSKVLCRHAKRRKLISVLWISNGL